MKEVIGKVDMYLGDSLEVLRSLPDESINCCVTSPPYYGLRDYGFDGQIGLEETIDKYLSKLVTVFSEVHRVLKSDGTIWVNMGDSYAGSGKGPEGNLNKGENFRHLEKISGGNIPSGLKRKDIMGMPWRLAFALQDFGWYLRQDIIWHKPNPMPESVTDRCTKTHEYIFLLSKSANYFYDHEEIKEPAQDWGKRNRVNSSYVDHKVDLGASQTIRLGIHECNYSETGRNKRSVWTVATRPYSEAHFATFPTKLIEPMILAGCPVGGLVLDPFGGSGTTGVVAAYLNRSAVLIEGSQEYFEIASRRLTDAQRQQRLFV